MYHLLVSYDGWAQDSDWISRGRVFEYTDDGVAEHFAPEGMLDAGRISGIPALFVSETGSGAPQEARIGYITRVRQNGSRVVIGYQYDSDIEPIPNPSLEKISSELDISEYEFTRTHWAIKEVNLFQVFLQTHPIIPFYPKVFNLDKTEQVNDNLISVMMPFNKQFDSVYTTLQNLASDLNLQCLRADDIWKHDAVIQDIVSLINRSKVVICDCSGRNPNVFYEIGIAHTLGREVILIAQSESDIPFDLRYLHFVTYLNNNEGHRELADSLRQRIQFLI